MNIPEIYLVEPYNAYAPKKKQKHWHEIVEEQALLAKIAAEQQAIMEANSRTLPPNSPDISTPTVVAIPPAGGGGKLPVQAFGDPTVVTVNFDRSPASGAGPLTVRFVNLTDNPELYTYNWEFSDSSGVLATSTDMHPTVIFDSGSSATDTITASLQATNSIYGTAVGVSPNVYISASKPTLTVAYTVTSSPNTIVSTAGYYTASTVDTLTFLNGATMTNGLWGPTLTNKWNFVGYDTSTETNPTFDFTSSGDYTVILSSTGSYDIKGSGTRKIQIIEPAITADIDPVWADAALSGSISGSIATPIVPFEVVFTDTSTNTLFTAPLSYLWDFGSGSITSTEQNPPTMSYTATGSYTVTLTVTGQNGASGVATRLVDVIDS